MSLPKAPDAIEVRKEIAASDPSDYSTIPMARGTPSNDFLYAMLKVKIEGTDPDVSFKTLVWDDEYGWLEHAEGGWLNATENFIAPIAIMGQRFFTHITINSGTSVKVSVRVSGHSNRLMAD
jgi:hypothetical protein